MIPPCSSVRLLYMTPPIFVAGPHRAAPFFYRIVRRGMRLGQFVVVHTSPVNGCMITYATKITFTEFYKLKVEYLEKNVLVRVIDSFGEATPYVYPRKVWERIWSDVIEPLMHDRKLKQQGAILYGPPGTGKSSMASLMAKYAGLEVVRFSPEKVLGKYVGETENKAMRLFKQAEQAEPSMLLMDDAEWATMSREALEGEAARAYTGLIDLMLTTIEEWNKTRRKIIAVVTTNVSESKLDPALRRGGRLGTPIYIPLPDVEAVRIILEEYGVEPGVADEWAVKIVNAGLPMADAVNIASDLVAGKKPIIEPKKGEGYTRYVPPDMSDNIRRYIEALRRIMPPLVSGMKLRVAAPEPVAIPLALAVVSLVYRAAAILVTDPRRVDSAMSAAEAAEGFVVEPTESHPPETQMLAYRAARIAFAGARIAPGLYAYPVRYDVPGVPSYIINKAIVEIVYQFYGIEYTQRDINTVATMSTSNLLESLAHRVVAGAKLARH